MEISLPRFLATLSLSVLPLAAIAADRSSLGHLSAAAGIVEPAFSTAVFQNPAGLTRDSGLWLSAQSGFSDSFKDPVILGEILYGSHSYGAAGGLTRSTQGSGSTSAFYGLGVHVEGIRTSFGVAGTTPVSPSGSTTFNAGLRSELGSQTALAVSAYNIGSGPAAFGGGLSYAIDSGFRVLSDLSCNKSFRGWEVQPGVLVGSINAALTVSYGFSLDSTQGRSGVLSNGLAVGGSFSIARSANLQIYYQQLSKYYAAFSWSL